MPKHLVAVLSNPVAGREEEYHDWYENLHIDEVLSSANWSSGQRFELVDEQGEAKCPRQFLALYEVETDSPETIIDGLSASRPQRQQSDSIDRRQAGIWIFSPTGPKHTA